MLKPFIEKNDRKAWTWIGILSVAVFLAITALARIRIDAQLPFDPHVFALINAMLNSGVAILLVVALVAIRNNNPVLHKNLMLIAIVLSILFLLSYVAHHLLTDPTKYGDVNKDGAVTPEEIAAVGSSRTLYYVLLFTHIPLAGIVLPFILFTAYRAATGEYYKHKKLARFTWPLWLYVAISGVIIYWMIQPYY